MLASERKDEKVIRWGSRWLPLLNLARTQRCGRALAGAWLMGLLVYWSPTASSTPACCRIVFTDETRGLVTAQETATGRVFQFSVQNKVLFPHLMSDTVFYIRGTSPDNRFSLGLPGTANVKPELTEFCCRLAEGSFVIGGGMASSADSAGSGTAIVSPPRAPASQEGINTSGGIAARELAAGVRLVILELKRVAENKLHLGFAIENRSSRVADPQTWGIAGSGKRGVEANGLMLLDLANGKRYHAGNSSIANSLQVAPGNRREFWAQYQAPPANVGRLAIQIPDAAPLYNVPIGK